MCACVYKLVCRGHRTSCVNHVGPRHWTKDVMAERSEVLFSFKHLPCIKYLDPIILKMFSINIPNHVGFGLHGVYIQMGR